MAHIYAVAGMAGVNYGGTVFDYGVDGHFSMVSRRGGRRHDTGHKLDFQAKATTNWELDSSEIVYDLEAKTYNDIVSRENSASSLILILLCLPKQAQDWHLASMDSTLLRHCCYWYLPSGDCIANTSKHRVRIPTANIFTPEVLLKLLAEERARRMSSCQ